MTKRAIPYARVSTTDQADRGESLPSQVKGCGGYITGVLGYELLEPLQEDISGGTRVVERPVGRKLFDMVNRGEVDAVVFHTADRLSRYLPDAYLTVEAWLKAGVEIYALDIGRITDPNDITFVIKGWQATDEKKKIRERTMRGRRSAIEGGRVVANGPAKFGYRFVGKKKETELAVVASEAEVVKQVFAWYVYGDGDGRPMGVVAIVDKLNALGVPTAYRPAPRTDKPSKRKVATQWTPGLVYPMLKAEVYSGVWNGYRFQMVEKNGKVSRQRRPADQWVSVSVPAIVDRDTWEKAQARLAHGRHDGRETARYEYLLAGRLKCSCGYHIQGHPTISKGKAYLYYSCNGRHNRNTVRNCEMARMRVSVWDEIVWNWVHELMLHPEKLAEGMRGEQDARRAEHAHLYARLEQAKAKIAEYDLDLDELGRQLYKRRISETFHDREKAIVERLRAGMVAERDETQETLAVSVLTDEQIANFEEFARDVAEGLEDASFADKRQYLQWLDFSGRYAMENGEPVLYARLEMVKGAAKRLRQVSETC